MANLPWVPGIYTPNQTIAEMILRSGQDQANRQERMGQNIAGSIQDIGGALSQGLQQRQAKKNAAQAQGAISQGMANPDAFEQVLQSLPPEVQGQARKGFADAMEASTKIAEGQQQIASGKARTEQARQAVIQQGRDHMATIAYRASQHMDGEDGGLGGFTMAIGAMKSQGVQGIDQFEKQAQDYTTLYQQAKASGDPAALAAVTGKIRTELKAGYDSVLMGARPEHMKLLEGEQPPGVVVPKNASLVNARTGTELFKGQPETPKVGTFEDYVTQKYGPRPTPEQTLQARKEYGQADDRARVSVTLGPPGTEGGFTPEGLELAATAYRLTKALPARNATQNAAIISLAAKQAKELGNSPVATIQRQAAYKADSTALSKMQSMSSAAEAFEQKAIQQADIVAGLSKKVDRTTFPILNSAILAGKREIQGDADTQLLFNAITTFTSEYAKIMEGSTGSAAASSDSARKAAGELIKASLNKETLAKTLDLMKREMRLSIQGYDATIAHITERMGGTPQPSAAPGGQAGPRVGDKGTSNGRSVTWDGQGWKFD